MPPSTRMLWNRYTSWAQSYFPGKPKKAIEDWDFIMVFEHRYREEIEAYFEKYLSMDSEGQGNRFKLVDHEKEEEILVLISIDQAEVLHQATELKILKKKNKKSFKFDLKLLNQQIYLAEQQKNISMCNYLKWIRARMLPGSENILEQERYSVFNEVKASSYIKDSEGKLFTSEEELRTKYNFLVNYSIQQKGASLHQEAKVYPLTDIMRHAGFKELVAVHKDSKYGSLIFGSIREYVGTNSQTYFDFVSFLQSWLLFPAAVGLLTVFFNIFFQFTAEDSPGDFLYALLIMVWSVVFITKWEQHEKWTKACEQTGYSDEWTEHQNIVDRSGCRARESRVSGQRELYVPFFQKITRYCISVTVCVSVLIGTLIFMVLSLNARGFVDQKHKFLYSETISGWAQPGGLFDASTGWGQIPNLVHVLVTNIFDEAIYRPLAKKFTRYEQHFQPKSYENSIIIKYFVYEYIITFADLFYIAFVRMDIIGLREQLLSLFFIDIVRRIVAELLIPKLKSKLRSYFVKTKESNNVEETALAAQAILEVNKEEYQPFDDYLEIITNFGYLVMISSCFPLAPVLILFAHSIESLQDKYKIVHIFKRKLPKKYVGMGYWKNIVVFLCYTSIVTNILLFAFSSHQIATIFPKLYESGKDLLLGNVEFTEVVQQAANSVFNAVMNTTEAIIDSAPPLFEQAFMQDSPFAAPECSPDFPFVQSFMPPAEQFEIEFISILFIIEHVFLIIFLCLRNVMTKQKCQADLLIERRQLKRSIKKYLNRQVLADVIRDSFVNSLFNEKKLDVKPKSLFHSLFNLGEDQTRPSTVEDLPSEDKSVDSKLE